MSRIIVKNLPKKVSEVKLKELFAGKGLITDLQLKYTKKGVFRQFAFVGYKTEVEAQAAKEYFNNTFVNASRIQVEICTNLGDPNKPKPWKKQHIQEKTEKHEVKNESLINETKKKKSKRKSKDIESEDETLQKSKKKSKKKHQEVEFPQKYLNDSEFKEFLEVHKDRKSKPTWCDGVTDFMPIEDPELSKSSESDGESGKDDCDITERQKLCGERHKPTEKLKTSSESSALSEAQKPKVKDTFKKKKIIDDQFTVKLHNLPYKCKKKQIKQFFFPLKPQSLRFPPKLKGFAYVKFKTEKEMNQALNKNKGFCEGRRIDVIKYIKKETPSLEENNEKKADEGKEKNDDLLAETGRIFVRNLCFSVTQSELEELFSKFGPIAEVHLPLDFLTKKGIGIAFVSYMFAEHAVKAFAELHGTIFQGRLLHLIPARPKKEVNPEDHGSNFKKKKEAKLKATSGSSHNWNILFLGMNAVADVISEKYNVEKSKLLSGDSKESVAVRMALAETQVVLDTRKFLLEQGVELDSFSQAAAERSKTIIVVKNLPAKTVSQEILDVFSKHGTVSRVILPPSGMVALVEFQEPTEAKTAFRKLAYTRFKHLPLYLEWAPVNAINPNVIPKEESQEETEKGAEIKSNVMNVETSGKKEVNYEPEEEDPEPDTTLFVKNINFDTTQEKFKEHFKQCGPIHSATISMKKDIKKGQLLSMGFGFVQFKQRASAVQALQNLQLSSLDGHSLELKFASRATIPVVAGQRKKYEVKKQKTCKILVRNIPFEATEKEVRDLFKEFGELKFVRLPKKMGGHEEHRGFGFVEYLTKTDAKRAFETLCHSTHLFGRRLVLEWANPEMDDVTELRRKTAKDFYAPARQSKVTKRKLNEDVALVSAKMHLD